MKFAFEDIMITFIVCAAIIMIFVAATTVRNSGKKAGIKLMQEEAIAQGCAEFNATNGVWQWKTNR